MSLLLLLSLLRMRMSASPLMSLRMWMSLLLLMLSRCRCCRCSGCGPGRAAAAAVREGIGDDDGDVPCARCCSCCGRSAAAVAAGAAKSSDFDAELFMVMAKRTASLRRQFNARCASRTPWRKTKAISLLSTASAVRSTTADGRMGISAFPALSCCVRRDLTTPLNSSKCTLHFGMPFVAIS